MPYISTEALGSRSPNLSVTRSRAAQGVLLHKESYGIRSPDQERLLVQERFAWLCLGVLVAPIFGLTRLAGPNQIWDALIPLSSVTPVFFFFKGVATRIATRIPCPTRMVEPNRSSVYSNRFHLSYQKHFIYVISF